MLAALLLHVVEASRAATEVLTNNYDAARTGANLKEVVLTVDNVRPRTFGRLYSYPVDGAVFGQPLLAAGINIPRQGVHDVVYIVTANNTVYAYDAYDGKRAPLWKRTLAWPMGTNATPRGILSTPVIDRGHHTLYVVAGFLQGTAGQFQVHALDLAHGGEKFHGPVLVKGAVTINGAKVPFQPTDRRIAVQRAALALAQGKLIVAFGGDYFEGWVFAYDQYNLRTDPGAFCTTCASRVPALSHIDYLDAACTHLGPGGGVWQAGRGPVVDARGRVYFFTGNKAHIIKRGCTIPYSDNSCAPCAAAEGCPCEGSGSKKVCRGPDTCIAHEASDHLVFDVNEALIQLDPRSGLKLTGWWRPANWDGTDVHGLEKNDLDLGGSGPLLIPGTQRLLGGGKQGVLYVLDTTSPPQSCVPTLTRQCMASRAQNPLQSFAVAPIPPAPREYYRHILGGPVLWARSPHRGGSRVFLWRENDVLRSYAISDRIQGCSTDDPAPATSHRCPSIAESKDFIDWHPGGILALSANGSDPSTAIVWASTNHVASGPGKLMAFQAVPETASPNRLNKLWDSDMCPEDRVEMGSDFTPPTVANGRLYLATASDRVDVFGLIKPRDCSAQTAPEGMSPLMQ